MKLPEVYESTRAEAVMEWRGVNSCTESMGSVEVTGSD